MANLRRIALRDIVPGPNARPRKPGALTWASVFAPREPTWQPTSADDLARISAERRITEERLPFDVSHIAGIRLDGNCAVMMQAPAVRSLHGDAAPLAPYSLIFGECRLWAALLAGATHLEVSVHDVDEKTAAIMHRLENSAHAPLPALAEAEELGALLVHFADPLALARAVERPVEEVRRRLALLRLCAPMREALAADATLEPVAVFWARHEELAQLDAWERSGVYRKAGPLRLTPSVRALFASLPIASARWAFDDATLPAVAFGFVGGNEQPPAKLRPCVGCPDRSDATGSLFADDTIATCLRPACWDAKSAAHDARIVERARGKGVPVIEGDAVRRFIPSHRTTVDDASGYVGLDDESPVEVGGKRLTWRMVIPATMQGVDAPVGVDQVVLDRDGRAHECITVERAAKLTRQRTIENDGPGGIEGIKALAAWSQRVAAQRSEVRESAPLPKASKPKAGGDARAKAEAAKSDEAVDVALEAIAAKGEKSGAETDLLCSLLIRVVSTDALCRVAERRELDDSGTPREALLAFVRGRIDVGDAEAIDGLSIELLAAHDCDAEGTDRAFDIASRWAGAGAKKAAKGAAPSSQPGAASASRRGSPKATTNRPACDCRPVPRKGPCTKTCASKMSGAVDLRAGTGTGPLPPSITRRAESPAPTLTAEQLEEIGGRCLAYIGKDGAHELDICEACGEDEEPGTIPVVLERLLDAGKVVREMPDRFYRQAPPMVEEEPAAPVQPALDTAPDPSILARAALATAIATICAGGGRKRLQLGVALRSSCPESSPADREAAITLAIEAGRLVEKPGGKLAVA